MSTSRWKTVLIASTALASASTGLGAEEWIGFYPITGELSVSADGRWTDFDTGSNADVLEFEERLRLHLGGYGLDPRIFNFNIDLEPAFEQESTNSDGQSASADTSYLDYGAKFSFLHGVPASPVSLRGNIERTTTNIDGSLGSRSDSVTQIHGGDLHWKFAPFPSTITYTERSLDETFVPGFGQAVTERENFQKTLSYRGASSKMQLYLDQIEFEDRIDSAKDYETQRGRLNNFFRWGRNSSFTSRLEYSDRQGFNAEEKAFVDESLRLQHASNLYTTYGYGYESLNRINDSETHRGNFGLNHRLYKNLDTSFRLSGSTTDSEQFQEDNFEGNLDFNYTKKFRPDLRVTANLGGGYGVTDRTGGPVDFSESLVVPDTLIVPLAQRFIVLSTLVVNLPGVCTPCTENTDYFVQDAGGDFTQLSIPLTSSISIGDTIDVTYTFDSPTAELSRIPYRVGLRVDYQAFSFYHSTVGENQNFIAGPDPAAVGDRRTDTTGISWTWTRGRDNASLGIERIYSDTISRSTTEYILKQSLTYGLAPRAVLSASVRESFLRDTTDADSYNGDVSIRWLPQPGLTVTPRISAYHRTVDPGSGEDFFKAGVDVNWRWRRLVSEFRYDHIIRETDNFGSAEDRVFVEVTRKF